MLPLLPGTLSVTSSSCQSYWRLPEENYQSDFLVLLVVLHLLQVHQFWACGGRHRGGGACNSGLRIYYRWCNANIWLSNWIILQTLITLIFYHDFLIVTTNVVGEFQNATICCSFPSQNAFEFLDSGVHGKVIQHMQATFILQTAPLIYPHLDTINFGVISITF